jgi:nickel-dependent lactate racemase
MAWFFERKAEIDSNSIAALTIKCAEQCLEKICKKPKKILLLPPDITRSQSGAGYIADILYKYFSGIANVWVMPALGQHAPHTLEQNKKMFPSIPEEKIIKHNCKTDTEKIGTITSDYVKEVTRGAANIDIPIEINKTLLYGNWDFIINIGQVVPHEVFGFSNHNKNYFIGVGGYSTISSSHIASACCGIENILGEILSPIRKCFNKAEEEFAKHLPNIYIMVVTTQNTKGNHVISGFYCGNNVETYYLAAKHSSQENIITTPALKKVVCLMREDKFSTTWVANKAIYRTRKAMENNGELIIIAPGLKKFGENNEADFLIRKYGYTGSKNIIKIMEKDEALKKSAHVAAHLMHGSCEQRFKITYAPGYLTKKEIEGVNYKYMDINTALEQYNPQKLKEGFNKLPNGEEIYFKGSPALGLWSKKN